VKTRSAFSLVEVVLALGVMAIAALAIIGVLPIGLSTGHSAQDETRASQISEDIFSAFASQAQTQFTAVALPIASPSPAPTIDLTSSNSPITNPAAFFYADNSGTLSNSATNAAYSISIGTNTAPGGFDTAFANAVTVRVVSPPLSNQTATAKQGQTVRDYQRVISKY